jgi:hypothetical protein
MCGRRESIAIGDFTSSRIPSKQRPSSADFFQGGNSCADAPNATAQPSAPSAPSALSGFDFDFVFLSVSASLR